MENDKHTHGFKTPEDYFETFEDRLFEKMDLEKLPKELPFNAPDGYFDNFEGRVLEQIKGAQATSILKPLQQKEASPKVVPFPRRKVLWYAASIAACFAMAILWNTQSNSFQTINSTDIEAYVTSSAMSLDTEDIALLLTEEDLVDLNTDAGVFSQENLENYLINHLDDTTLLIE